MNTILFKRGRLFKKGFTLIELLVVIAIIGILTAIVMANFTTAKSKARDAKRISDIAQLQLTLEQIFDKCNQYPLIYNTLGVLTTTSVVEYPSSDTCKKNDGTTDYQLGDFISVIPKDSFGNNYSYISSSDGMDYVLRATLENYNSNVLDDDVDSPIGLSIDCNDSPSYYYCVQPK